MKHENTIVKTDTELELENVISKIKSLEEHLRKFNYGVLIEIDKYKRKRAYLLQKMNS